MKMNNTGNPLKAIMDQYFGKDTEDVQPQIVPEKRDFAYGENAYRLHSEDKVYGGQDYERVVNRQIADDNIDDLDEIARILKTLCNAAWGDDWGELSTDLKKGENSSEIILPQIVLDINTKDVAEGIGGPKPKLIDVVKETDEAGNETGDSFLVYRQWFDTNVEFNIYGRTNAEARKLQRRFEKLIMVYTGYLKRQGISEIMYEREVSAKFSLNYDEKAVMRCIFYYIRLESIIPVRQSQINSINLKIGANQVDAEQVKTLIQNSAEKPVELDFFDGDNGITFNKEY